MKVFNLTDVHTDALVRRGLYKQTIVVGNQAIQPGQSAEINEQHRNMVQKQLEHLVLYGAAAINELPKSYVVAKQKLQQSTPAVEAPAKVAEAVPTPKGS